MELSVFLNDEPSCHFVGYDVNMRSRENEIDAASWYETEMLHCKPDIMQFMDDMKHFIFHLQWNSQTWLDQLKLSVTHNRGSRENDLIRHLLRMTVMLNTIGVVLKNSYMIGYEEVRLKMNSTMQTIVYDHRSKLEKGGKKTMTKTPYESTTVQVINQDCLLAYEKSGKRWLSTGSA